LDEPVVPVIASIATAADGSPVAAQEWVRSQLANAEDLYAPLGLHFRLTEWRSLPSSASLIANRTERDALAPLCAPQAINVHVVAQLRDVDATEEAYRMGVTWIGRGVKYIIVATSARPSTLAHEIGHFFGLHHTKVKNNLMSYDRDGAPVFLDAEQTKTVIGAARAMVATHQLFLESWALAGSGPLHP
jgi:hypothetical protein